MVNDKFNIDFNS